MKLDADKQKIIYNSKNDSEFEKFASEIFDCGKHDCPMHQYLSSDYRPVAFAGNPDADIIVVGINPKKHLSTEKDDYLKKFEDDTPEKATNEHDYFKKCKGIIKCLLEEKYPYHLRFATLLEGIDPNLDKTIFLEVVKCATEKFNSRARNAVKHCQKYLECQIELIKPKIIIANGMPAIEFFIRGYSSEHNLNFNEKDIKQFKIDKTQLYYNRVPVIFTGFLNQRMERTNPPGVTRLRKEIEAVYTFPKK